ncbi:hypothetical protein BMS3Bbin04_01047 [bacterium BMS3Bbin04]|nr:hypothetical protein BMS3Bbin04_01047 [bacterium BMS3Bbin04]
MIVTQGSHIASTNNQAGDGVRLSIVVGDGVVSKINGTAAVIIYLKPLSVGIAEIQRLFHDLCNDQICLCNSDHGHEYNKRQ